MKQDMAKTAAQTMLSPTEAEAERLAQDVEQIFALTAALADASPRKESMDLAVGREELRADIPGDADTERHSIRLSKNEKEGFVRVARTVG